MLDPMAPTKRVNPPQPAGPPAPEEPPADAGPLTSPTARRRQTVRLDARRLSELMTQAEQAERTHAAHRRGWQAGRQALPPPSARLDADACDANARGRLKAFLDAARPRGGLPLAADGWPTDLAALWAQGQAAVAAGELQPRLWRNVRAGAAVDLRLAQAALQFFRVQLQQPGLTLTDLGAVDADRVDRARHLGALMARGRDDLPRAVWDALALRADEAASTAWLFEGYERHYRLLDEQVGPDGVLRLQVHRHTRYRPFKLNTFAMRLRPTQSVELHELNRFQAPRLRLSVLSPDGRELQRHTPALRRRIDAERSIVVTEIDPQAAPAWAHGVESPAVRHLAEQQRFEVAWDETLWLNATDRDLLVAYQPVDRPRVKVDAATRERLHFQIGDSPGLTTDPEGWRLDRTLMPREVLAVRLRSRTLNADSLAALSPSGEWRARPAASAPAPAQPPTRAAATPPVRPPALKRRRPAPPRR